METEARVASYELLEDFDGFVEAVNLIAHVQDQAKPPKLSDTGTQRSSANARAHTANDALQAAQKHETAEKEKAELLQEIRSLGTQFQHFEDQKSSQGILNKFRLPMSRCRESFRSQRQVSTEGVLPPGSVYITPAEGEVPLTDRHLYVVAMRPEGVPLQSAVRPSEMLEGVLHAMLGHWALFKTGWLHRDVSDGNVLLMVGAEIRDFTHAADVLPVGQFDKTCKGFIIDGDHALNWRNPPQAAPSRSGTLQFLSRYVLDDWIQAQEAENQWPSTFCQTAIDDLESFFWVLYIAILRRAQKQGTATQRELNTLINLSKEELTTLSAHKEAMMSRLHLKHPNVNLMSPLFLSFLPLLRSWGATLDVLRDKILDPENPSLSNSNPEAYVSFCREQYKELLRAGFEYLEHLFQEGF